jgi:hypothetical protein
MDLKPPTVCIVLKFLWVKITKVANYKFGFMMKKLGSYDYEN